MLTFITTGWYRLHGQFVSRQIDSGLSLSGLGICLVEKTRRLSRQKASKPRSNNCVQMHCTKKTDKYSSFITLTAVHPPSWSTERGLETTSFARFSSKKMLQLLYQTARAVEWTAGTIIFFFLIQVMVQKYKSLFQYGYPLYINDFNFERWSMLTEKAVCTKISTTDF